MLIHISTSANNDEEIRDDARPDQQRSDLDPTPANCDQENNPPPLSLHREFTYSQRILLIYIILLRISNVLYINLPTMCRDIEVIAATSKLFLRRLPYGKKNEEKKISRNTQVHVLLVNRTYISYTHWNTKPFTARTLRRYTYTTEHIRMCVGHLCVCVYLWSYACSF